MSFTRILTTQHVNIICLEYLAILLIIMLCIFRGGEKKSEMNYYLI